MNMAMKILSRSASLRSQGLMRGSRILILKKLLCLRNMYKGLFVKVMPISNSQCLLYQYSRTK